MKRVISGNILCLLCLGSAALSSEAWADGVQIEFFGSQLGSSELGSRLGGPTSGSLQITELQPVLPGALKGSHSVSGGVAGFTTPDPTSVYLGLYPPVYINLYGKPGGDLTVTGSLFDLPAGSTLMTATFGAAGTSAFVDPTVEVIGFNGSLIAGWVNPALLSDLGIRTQSAGFTGTIGVTRFINAGTGILETDTAISVVPIPEPGELLLVGSGLVWLAIGLTWRKNRCQT
jgi:hypothetical protein